MRALRTPAICAVNGLAYGGGLELALSCDVRLAAEHATFAAPEIKLGWIGGGGMTYLLTHSIGASNAAQMVLTGDPVDAERALRMSLVSELLPADELLARAQELAATIASRPPIAAQTGKANLRAAYAMPLEAAVGYERDLQTICFATEDAREGRAAFRERRPGVFRGRCTRQSSVRALRAIAVSSCVNSGYGPMPASIASTTARRLGLPAAATPRAMRTTSSQNAVRLVEERARLGATHDRVVRRQEQLRRERAQALDRAAVAGQVVDARRDQQLARAVADAAVRAPRR